MIEIVDHKQQIIEKYSDLFTLVLDPEESKYIVGINSYCDHLLEALRLKKINVSGIVDDFTSQKHYSGLPIVRTEDLPKDALVISCVLDGKLTTVIKRLKGFGITKVFTYFELYLKFPDLIQQIRFCENNVQDIEKNKEKYIWLYSILADEQSIQTLQHLIDFRYNFNVDAMLYFPYKLEQQYFDTVSFGSQEVFVDCGGFDGATTRTFISMNHDYKKVFYFEPSAKQFEISKRNLSTFRDIVLHNMATFSENTTLNFNAALGSSSSISSDGNDEVKAVRLDDIINEKITYLKLDVEGAELDTLIGAEQLIRSYKPKIAVCVYHEQSDFWKIPELLLQYNPDYKVYLQHYTEGLLESVMYFK